ncbi:MAG TPA: hypothetical protein VK509_20600, partial [Polyangiales bacterium]|nr:hypothetical protein [Polyangiales bacterium]
QLAARGDWAWVYRSPDGARAARLCPYDPAYRLHLSYCQRYAGNPYLPTVHQLRELEHGAHLVVLEWLEASDETAAYELGARLGFPDGARKRFGATRAHALEVEGASDPALREIRTSLRQLIAEGERELPFFGGVDLRPANILRTAQGQLQLIDPIFVAGREIIAALRRDPAAVAQRIPPSSLRAWLQIACFEQAGSDPAFQALQRIVEDLAGTRPAV